jgi:hypothetical protein
VGDKAGDGGAAGVVGAEDLPPEDPQRHQRGEHPVEPAAQRLGDNVLGERVAATWKRSTTVQNWS